MIQFGNTVSMGRSEGMQRSTIQCLHQSPYFSAPGFLMMQKSMLSQTSVSLIKTLLSGGTALLTLCQIWQCYHFQNVCPYAQAAGNLLRPLAPLKKENDLLKWKGTPKETHGAFFPSRQWHIVRPCPSSVMHRVPQSPLGASGRAPFPKLETLMYPLLDAMSATFFQAIVTLAASSRCLTTKRTTFASMQHRIGV